MKISEKQIRQIIKESINELSESIDEKAKSKAQQRFFGMVRAYQKGELKGDEVSSEVKDAAKSMKKKDVKDFAETKHKGLPNHVKKEKTNEGIEKDYVYTMDDWRRDGMLKVKEGQYISAEVYNKLLCDVPPTTASNGVFQPGEPYTTDNNNRYLYRTFKIGEHDGKRMWQYVGLMYAQRVNESKISVTRNELKSIIRECVTKIMYEKYKNI